LEGRDDKPPKGHHGTKNGYSYHKCRCELCTSANRETQKARRLKITPP
jgi:hypothetical protein